MFPFRASSPSKCLKLPFMVQSISKICFMPQPPKLLFSNTDNYGHEGFFPLNLALVLMQQRGSFSSAAETQPRCGSKRVKENLKIISACSAPSCAQPQHPEMGVGKTWQVWGIFLQPKGWQIPQSWRWETPEVLPKKCLSKLSKIHCLFPISFFFFAFLVTFRVSRVRVPLPAAG